MSANAVELRSASRSYGDVRAVDGVSLTVLDGEFFTLLGSSGSGKTTILRLIAGFERPDAGRVLVGGSDVTERPAYRRDVHTVFQDYALFPHMTVGENVAFALDLKSVAADEVRERVARALRLVQLEGYGERRPAQLSGGQQQRVALARAIVDEPAVLLLDEPLSALDAKIRHELREQLKRLQRETRITFVYVTHDQEEALTLSDRLAVMRSGRILQQGTPMEVYEKPADLFVAEFIGKANFVAGMVESVDGARVRVRAMGRTVEAALAVPGLRAGAAVRVMIRPENVALSAAGGPGFEARIVQSQYEGHATRYLVEAGSILFHVLELRRRGAIPRPEGSTVTLGWIWDEALVYPES
jgi:spermidine/putrescine transport system ATP-binding protein